MNLFPELGRMYLSLRGEPGANCDVKVLAMYYHSCVVLLDCVLYISNDFEDVPPGRCLPSIFTAKG